MRVSVKPMAAPCPIGSPLILAFARAAIRFVPLAPSTSVTFSFYVMEQRGRRGLVGLSVAGRRRPVHLRGPAGKLPGVLWWQPKDPRDDQRWHAVGQLGSQVRALPRSMNASMQVSVTPR